jgi:biotin/methionine sulfoxide reductase
MSESPSGHHAPPRQTASHWGVYNVAVDAQGRLIEVGGHRQDPHPSPLNSGMVEAVHSQLRITQPHVRHSYLKHGHRTQVKRGSEAFVPVSWEQALDLVAQELMRVKTEHGNEAIYGGSYGWASAGRLHHAPSLLKRFLGLHGGYVDKRGNHSWGAAYHIMPYVIGRADISQLTTAWPAVLGACRLIVMFGGAPIKNAEIANGGEVRHESREWLARAKEEGIEFVNVSPVRSDAMQSLDAQWLPIRPNTDVALMLALAHTLLTDDLHDREFLARYCVGFEEFSRYLLGRSDRTPKDAAWAAGICGVSMETIATLARRMASTRTMITTSWSIQRADHGEQPYWMTVVLAAMLGQIGLPGGGFSFGFGANSNITSPRNSDIPRPKISLGRNAVQQHVPVAMVGDMLSHPGKVIDYNGSKLTYPDIRIIHSMGGNPFHHNTNLNAFLPGWQRPETVIVHEPWWNPASRHADIVLPSTTSFERNDIMAAELGRDWVSMHQVIAPVHQSRNDFDILADLSARMGFESQFTEGLNEMGWLRHMYEEARVIAIARGYAPPSFDEFWQTGIYEFPVSQPSGPLLGEFVAQPVKHPLQTPSGRIEIYSAKIGSFGYEDCPPHPVWMEPAEWLGSALTDQYPLHLLSNQPGTRLHSQNDMATVSRSSKVADREPIHLSAADAESRGICPGDIVRVFNSRGAFLAGAAVDEGLMQGVVQIATGAWFDPAEPGVPGSLEKHGNPNVVTLGKGTSRLGQSSTAQTVLVEIEKYHGSPPQVTAFDHPPTVVSLG